MSALAKQLRHALLNATVHLLIQAGRPPAFAAFTIPC